MVAKHQSWCKKSLAAATAKLLYSCKIYNQEWQSHYKRLDWLKIVYILTIDYYCCYKMFEANYTILIAKYSRVESSQFWTYNPSKLKINLISLSAMQCYFFLDTLKQSILLVLDEIEHSTLSNSKYRANIILNKTKINQLSKSLQPQFQIRCEEPNCYRYRFILLYLNRAFRTIAQTYDVRLVI